MAARAEVNLNRGLAPDVDLGLLPLVMTPHGFSLRGDGPVADWLVIMRRLDDTRMIERGCPRALATCLPRSAVALSVRRHYHGSRYIAADC